MEDKRGPGLLAWAGIVLALGTSLYNSATVFGELKGQVVQNAKDIDAIRADRLRDSATLYEIDRRTARMETKLEILLPTPSLKAAQQ